MGSCCGKPTVDVETSYSQDDDDLVCEIEGIMPPTVNNRTPAPNPDSSPIVTYIPKKENSENGAAGEGIMKFQKLGEKKISKYERDEDKISPAEPAQLEIPDPEVFPKQSKEVFIWEQTHVVEL